MFNGRDILEHNASLDEKLRRRSSLLAEYVYDKLVSQAMVNLTSLVHRTKLNTKFFFLTAKTDHFELNLLWTQSK